MLHILYIYDATDYPGDCKHRQEVRSNFLGPVKGTSVFCHLDGVGFLLDNKLRLLFVILNSNKMNKQKKRSSIKTFFDKASNKITRATGSSTAFLIAMAVIIVWAASGPIFKFSDTWQLVINTGTTIITFLMVFVIQQSQNKDTIAMQIKLNELIACNEKASNRLIDVEDLTEDEINALKKFYIKLSELAKKEDDIKASHSLEEAMEIHSSKKSQKLAIKKNK